MPYGVYKKGEEFAICYSACENTLRMVEEGSELLGIYLTEREARDAKERYETF